MSQTLKTTPGIINYTESFAVAKQQVFANRFLITSYSQNIVKSEDVSNTVKTEQIVNKLPITRQVTRRDIIHVQAVNRFLINASHSWQGEKFFFIKQIYY